MDGDLDRMLERALASYPGDPPAGMTERVLRRSRRRRLWPAAAGVAAAAAAAAGVWLGQAPAEKIEIAVRTPAGPALERPVGRVKAERVVGSAKKAIVPRVPPLTAEERALQAIVMEGIAPPREVSLAPIAIEELEIPALEE